jgi:hypothetical protein
MKWPTQLGCLAFCIDVNQKKTEAYHREMKVRQENMEAAIQSIPSKLDELIKHRVKHVLACVDQRTQNLRKESNKMIDDTQVDLQLVMSSLDS